MGERGGRGYLLVREETERNEQTQNDMQNQKSEGES